jgi:hypothetical protein
MDKEEELRQTEDSVSMESKRSWLRESGIRDDEMAADFAVTPSDVPAAKGTGTGNSTERSINEHDSQVRSAGNSLGWVALAFGVISLFLWPLLMGATAAVLGFVAYREGSRTLGVWSITLGLIAVAAYFLLSPLYVVAS